MGMNYLGEFDDIYSDLILDLYKNPVNKGKIHNHDLHIEGGNPVCGDKVVFEMKIKNEIIEDIKFDGNGCAISTAAESLLTELVKGKKVSEAEKLTTQQMFDALGGKVIEARIKCAILGLYTLQKGIIEYKKNPAKNKIITGIVIK
ncbi:MAG: SUF system NifU family Fe-S cluster assembly protein [archaeon]|nr:SUF system NifU family Fe-S cluster assembly protein [archaeon]